MLNIENTKKLEVEYWKCWNVVVSLVKPSKKLNKNGKFGEGKREGLGAAEVISGTAYTK